MFLIRIRPVNCEWFLTPFSHRVQKEYHERHRYLDDYMLMREELRAGFLILNTPEEQYDLEVPGPNTPMTGHLGPGFLRHHSLGL